MKLKHRELFSTIFHILVAIVSSGEASNVNDERIKPLSRGTGEGFAYANFKPQKFSYLNVTSIGSDYVLEDSECGFVCANTPSCFSFNLGVFSAFMGKVLCELLPSDVFNNSDKFVYSQSHHHYSITSPCISWPCRNNGTCAAQYEDNSFVCICKKGFKGKDCEFDIDECAEGLHSCDVHAYCNNTAGSYTCTCKPTYHGDGENCILPMNSVILQGNSSYIDDLAQFLKPINGNHSRWMLCYRASTHGWRISTFHTKCDGKRDTVSIIKVGQYVFGGYTNISWESSGGYTSTSKAFIFSLVNNEGLPPFKSLVTSPQYAIKRTTAHGVTFGGGHDICINDNANSNTHSYANFGHSYSVPSGIKDKSTILAGTYSFKPDELEVFFLD